MKIFKMMDDESHIDNMYPRIFKGELYYVTVTCKYKSITIDRFVTQDDLSIHLSQVALFNNIDDAEKYATKIIESSEIPSEDICHITIKHVVKGLCRKCGQAERRDKMFLCLPCSYT